jgi:hypothetical protein
MLESVTGTTLPLAKPQSPPGGVVLSQGREPWKIQQNRKFEPARMNSGSRLESRTVARTNSGTKPNGS